jgi:hypothetical protein
MKICTTCGVNKPLSEYYKGSKDGKQSHCKKCDNTRKNTQRAKIRNDFTIYKKTLSCAHCLVDDYRVLDFHHTSDDKDFNVSKMVSSGHSIKSIMLEVDKCQVLCSNCHRIVHYED